MTETHPSAPKHVPPQSSFIFHRRGSGYCESAQCEGGHIVIVTTDGLCEMCAIREANQ